MSLDDLATAAGPEADGFRPLHPLQVPLAEAAAGLDDGPALTALLAVLKRHSPATWYPERTWVTCAECSVLAWPPPTDPAAMWSDVVYPCQTVLDVTQALGVPVPEWYTAQDQVSKRVEALIERSSLGTAEAVLLRASVPDDAAARILERSKQIGLAPKRRPPTTP